MWLQRIVSADHRAGRLREAGTQACCGYSQNERSWIMLTALSPY